MPPLSNPRHERFAQALLQGETADAAYEQAGFKANRGNASRLKANDSILARLSELQATAAKAAEVTVQSLLGELEEARSRADSLDQLSAAVRAIEAKAKVSGLLVQKVEVGVAGEFDGCNTVEEVADKLLQEPAARFRPVDDRDRHGLVDLLKRHGEELQHYLASIQARPIVGATVTYNPAKANKLTAR